LQRFSFREENFGVRAALAILDLLATKGPAVNGAGGKAHLGNVTVMLVNVNDSQALR
tara:strand:+ start:1797 stop:1967 length:171 start_codon:yes stop_codon:yes gene_type:complete